MGGFSGPTRRPRLHRIIDRPEIAVVLTACTFTGKCCFGFVASKGYRGKSGTPLAAAECRVKPGLTCGLLALFSRCQVQRR